MRRLYEGPSPGTVCSRNKPYDTMTALHPQSLQTLLLGDNLVPAPHLAALLRTLPRLQDHDLGPELDTTQQQQQQQLHCDLLYSDPQVLLTLNIIFGFCNIKLPVTATAGGEEGIPVAHN